MSHDSLLLKLVAETKFNEQLCHRKLIIEKYWGIKCFKKYIDFSIVRFIMLLAETSGDKYISSFLTLIHKKELEKSTSQYFKFCSKSSE